MNKKVLYNSIKKVFLDLKDVEHFIFWDLSEGNLTLKSLDTAYNTTIMSMCSVRYPMKTDSSFVIKDPGDMLKMIDIIEENVSMTINLKAGDNFIVIKDDSFEGKFIITDINYIPPHVLEKKNMAPEEPISYDVQIPLDSVFIDKFSKARRANKSSTVTVWTDNRVTYFELGDINNFSNKIKFSMEFPGMFNMDKLIFSADIIQAVLDRNKSGVGKMFIEPEGLMKLWIEDSIGDDKMESTYFIVAQDII